MWYTPKVRKAATSANTMISQRQVQTVCRLDRGSPAAPVGTLGNTTNGMPTPYNCFRPMHKHKGNTVQQPLSAGNPAIQIPQTLRAFRNPK